MGRLKATMIFVQGQYGWTESYFKANASPDLQTDMDSLKILAVKRIPLSGQQTTIDYLKVSDEEVSRDSLLFSYIANGGNPPHGTSGKDSDVRFTAALIRRQNANHTKTSNLLLRGVWDDVINASGFNSNDTAWRPLFNAFAGELTSTASGWGFPAKDTATSKKVVISNVTQNVNGQLVFTVPATTFAGPPWGYKSKVFISGVKGAVLANGSQIVTPTSDTSCTTVARIPIFPYLGGGLMTVNTLAFVKTAFADPLRAVKRATGRPLFLSRGRSRVRKLA